MKVLLFYDQTQAGAGGKERPNVPLAIEKGGIGSYHMFEKNLKDIDATVLATMYVGNGYFFDNEEEVTRKIAAMTEKLKADVILCGPCFDYQDYAKMSAIVAKTIEETTDAKAIVMCSKENEETINTYKDEVTIVKMPKKGGTGLKESFSNMTQVMKAKHEGDSKDTYASFVY